MKTLSSLVTVLCCTCIGSGMISMLAPQKRTKRTFSFILGIFIVTVLVSSVRTAVDDGEISLKLGDIPDPVYEENEYTEAAAKMTADNLVEAADELLKSEGITADDIRLSIKISDEGRIYIDRVSIYISDGYYGRKDDIKRIIYGNFSKEPEIYDI